MKLLNLKKDTTCSVRLNRNPLKVDCGSMWKSHSTLTLLATQNYPFWLKYD